MRLHHDHNSRTSSIQRKCCHGPNQSKRRSTRPSVDRKPSSNATSNQARDATENRPLTASKNQPNRVTAQMRYEQPKPPKFRQPGLGRVTGPRRVLGIPWLASCICRCTDSRDKIARYENIAGQTCVLGCQEGSCWTCFCRDYCEGMCPACEAACVFCCEE